MSDDEDTYDEAARLNTRRRQHDWNDSDAEQLLQYGSFQHTDGGGGGGGGGDGGALTDTAAIVHRRHHHHHHHHHHHDEDEYHHHHDEERGVKEEDNNSNKDRRNSTGMYESPVIKGNDGAVSEPENKMAMRERYRRSRRRHMLNAPLARKFKRDANASRRERRRLKRELSTVQTYALSKSFDIDRLYAQLNKRAVVASAFLSPSQNDNALLHVQRFTDVVCLRVRDGEIFVFEYGCVVLWNISEWVEKEYIELIRPCMIDQLSTEDVEDDDYEFFVGEKSNVSLDVIQLSSDEMLEKLAVSYALAISIRLSVFEEMVEVQINENRQLPEQLARAGEITLDSRELSKRIGRIFLQRSEVNLHSDILDTPDFFWEYDKYLEFFNLASGYLEISKRAEILNTRLDVMKEMLDMFSDAQSASHEIRLEWIIIILILAEVVLELGVMILQIFLHRDA